MKDVDPITEQDASAPQSTTELLHGRAVSGLYATLGSIPGLETAIDETTDIDLDAAGPPLIPALAGEELRLDVDGRYPQMTASGTLPISPVQRLHWIANVHATGPNAYEGGIWYKDPLVTPFAYTHVEIKVSSSILPAIRKAKVTFTGAGLRPRVRLFRFRSPYFHKVEFEFDSENPIVALTKINTCAHPNHPATLPCEQLTVKKVFQRSGFDVSITPAMSTLPAPAGGTWSNMEMHDAMVVYWSKFANIAQWSMWTFFADQHEIGHSLGGIMFDDIGPNHRQGTSIFYNSFISDPPPGDPNPVAYVERNRFWTAVHEMGHAFNLAHSWQKSLGAPYGTPWIPLVDEPEARSFMNYPYGVSGGQSAFFADFEYRFSDPELLFMRHAPARFVRMGDADWFDHHGFQQARLQADPPLSLEVRVNRAKAVFEFLEPVVIELKLKNESTMPQMVDENVLSTLDGITIALKRQGSPARQYLPFAQYCMEKSVKILQPGEAIYESVYVTAGLNGVDMAEPGRYVIQAALHRPDGDIVSRPLLLRIAPPRGHEEEVLAQDFFSDEVSRVLAFDGSRVLTEANKTLREVVDRFGDRRVSKHARVPLGLAIAEDRKVLTVPGAVERTLKPAAAAGGSIMLEEGQPDRAQTELTTALLTNADVAAESLGHVDYKYYVDELTDLLEAHGEIDEAAEAQDTLYKILAARNVLPRVLQEIEDRRLQLVATARQPRKGRGKNA
ncbi:MAG TPA: hypothetical protein VFJ02_11310 [Vicinamibacterales bacterium]|nr:hypothetical protein [Vicinamibacterales bacterium]